MTALDCYNLSHLKMNISMPKVCAALQLLREQTKAPLLEDAITLMHYRKRNRDHAEALSLLVTLWRASKDGEVQPPVDLEDLYRNMSL